MRGESMTETWRGENVAWREKISFFPATLYVTLYPPPQSYPVLCPLIFYKPRAFLSPSLSTRHTSFLSLILYIKTKKTFRLFYSPYFSNQNFTEDICLETCL